MAQRDVARLDMIAMGAVLCAGIFFVFSNLGSVAAPLPGGGQQAEVVALMAARAELDDACAIDPAENVRVMTTALQFMTPPAFATIEPAIHDPCPRR